MEAQRVLHQSSYHICRRFEIAAAGYRKSQSTLGCQPNHTCLFDTRQVGQCIHDRTRA